MGKEKWSLRKGTAERMLKLRLQPPVVSKKPRGCSAAGPGLSERDNPDQGTIVTGVPRFTLLKKFSDMCSGMRMQP
jgi:hypothetical protein